MSPLPPAEFDRQVRAALPRLGRVAGRLTNDPHAAEDVVGETLLRAARGREGFRGGARLETWLHAILINCFRDHLRRRGRPEPPAVPRPAGMPKGPPRLAESREHGRLIAAAVAGLPPRQREAVVLTHYAHLPAAEAAAVMDTTPTNVRVLLTQGRVKLREQLRGLIEED